MFRETLFIQANKTWNLETIAQEIANIKFKHINHNQFNTVEEIILNNLLDHSNLEIDLRQLPGILPGKILVLIRNMSSDLQKKSDFETNKNYDFSYDFLTLLALAGYKKIINDNQKNTETTDYNNISRRDNTSQENNSVNQILSQKETELSFNVDDFASLHSWNFFGGLFSLSLLGVGIILAATIKYDVTVKADAVIRPEGEIRLVQATRKGIIQSINVKENEIIEKGQVIARIDDTKLQTEKKSIIKNLEQNELTFRQINDQIKILEEQIIAENIKSDRIIASAQAELQKTQTAYRQETITNQALVNEARAKLNFAQQELLKSQVELKSFEANLNSTEAALIAAKSKRDRYQKILAYGAISQEQFEEAQLAVEQQKQNLASQKANFLSQKQTIEGQKQQVEIAKAQLLKAETTLKPNRAVITIAQEAIKREKANKNATIASYNREKKGLIEKRIEIEKQIFQEQQQLQQLLEQIKQSTLRATTDGTILKLDLRNQNQVVNPQDTVAQIVPKSSNFIIKAQIEPQERDRIAVGQLVKLKIHSCPYPDYGILSGKVVNISADTLESSEPGNKKYVIDILPETNSLKKGTNICSLQLGMSATANIITREETPLKFLLRKGRIITDW